MALLDSYPVPSPAGQARIVNLDQFEQPFKAIYSFVFVRHPFERLVSAYRMYELDCNNLTKEGTYTCTQALSAKE